MAIDRENPRNAIVTINKAARLMKEEKLDIAIYPEGTRNKAGGLLPFHNGVFKIAQKAGAPMAVICITGTQNIHKRTPFRRTDVYLDVLEVIPAEEITSTRTDAIGQHVRTLLLENLEKRENR